MIRKNKKLKFEVLKSEIHKSQKIRECIYCGFVIYKGIEYFATEKGDSCMAHTKIITIEEKMQRE